MMIGRHLWAMAEAYIPGEGIKGDPTLVSHETACILNTQNADAHLPITIYLADRESAGTYHVIVPARRTMHARFNGLDDPETVPRDTDFASGIKSYHPVDVQHTRLDSRHPDMALLSTIAFLGECE